MLPRHFEFLITSGDDHTSGQRIHNVTDRRHFVAACCRYN